MICEEAQGTWRAWAVVFEVGPVATTQELIAPPLTNTAKPLHTCTKRSETKLLGARVGLSLW